MKRVVLTIAGFDPSSGAGITADLAVFAAHGLFGLSAITALTVQSTLGVRSVEPVSAATLAATLECLHADLPPAGVKIGMLATEENVEAVASYLELLKRDRPETPVVLDPIVSSSSGRELLSPEGLRALRECLLPLATWVTPNLAELSQLTGQPVTVKDEVEPAARSLHATHPRLSILVTGGHLSMDDKPAQPDDLLLIASGEAHWLPGERIESTSTHGTGCALSSALLSRLVLGDSPLEAAAQAKQYVAEAIRRAEPIGGGHGPLNHLWALRR
jgi:hydroxymethylpyrimidine/phosphomethylpyrimidine kinase